MVVKADASKILTPEDIYDAQIALPDGSLVPVSSLANLERTAGISEIRHYNGTRTITLQVTPPIRYDDPRSNGNHQRRYLTKH